MISQVDVELPLEIEEFLVLDVERARPGAQHDLTAYRRDLGTY